MESGFPVAVPRPGSQAPQMRAGFCFLICVQVGTEWHVQKSVGESTGSWVWSTERIRGRLTAARYCRYQTERVTCPVCVPQKSHGLWEGKGSEAARPGRRLPWSPGTWWWGCRTQRIWGMAEPVTGVAWRFREWWAWALAWTVRPQWKMRWGRSDMDWGICGKSELDRKQLRCLRDI